MKTNLSVIVLTVLVVGMVSIQGLNENRIAKKEEKIRGLEEHIEELYVAEAERVVQEYESKLHLSPPMETFWLTSKCGIRTDPMGGGVERLHEGIDLVGESGAKILAAANGIIVDHWVPPDGGQWKGHPIFGGCIVIDHGGGVFTLYGHMADTFVHIGDGVRRGQVIGIQGSTGISVGEHLHFEVIYDPEVAMEKGITLGSE